MTKKKDKAVKTLILDLFGGPGTGKSTTAALIFYYLKTWGFNAELVREYVKSWAWEGRNIRKYDQIYFFGKQSRYESHLYGCVDVIVTDCPVGLTRYYGRMLPKELSSALGHTVDAYYEETAKDGFLHVPVFLERSKRYNPKGRWQTEAQAKKIDRELRKILYSWYPAEEIWTCATDKDSVERAVADLLIQCFDPKTFPPEFKKALIRQSLT